MTAQPIGCDICGQELATMMVSNLENGDTLGIGGACVVGWLRGTADIMDPPTKPNRKGSAPPDPAGNDGETAPNKARRPRGKAQRLSVVPEGADDTGEATTPDDATAD